MPKTRNIIIFVAIAAVVVLGLYFFMNQSSSSQPSSDLVTSPSATTSSTGGTTPDISTLDGNAVDQTFITLLLSVKTLTLNTDILSDPAFVGLHDSSITLTPDATTGRPNPFAQFGAGNATASTPTPVVPSSTTPATPATTPPTTTTPVVPTNPITVPTPAQP